MTGKKTDIKIIEGDGRIPVIAPHGKAAMPGDDCTTDKITFAVAQRPGCGTVVNDVFKQDGKGGRDFNVISNTPEHRQFIREMKRLVNTDGRTLVVWLHGATDVTLRQEAKTKSSAFNASRMTCTR